MADDASGNDADLAVPRHVAGDAPDDGAFDASLGLGGGRSQHQAQNGSSKDQRLHDGPPNKTDAATIRDPAIGSATGPDKDLAAADTDNGRRICNMTVARGREMDDDSCGRNRSFAGE